MLFTAAAAGVMAGGSRLRRAVMKPLVHLGAPRAPFPTMLARSGRSPEGRARTG